ncbi:MAG: putative toxin-antitoxin system toxin component, PIN family [bacterium]|nr:putative toxin-antitoxin system toxin component, PIN family [bacterium]MDE0601844.1 putative toxin-antitoxin system toxin component, PIN family [bacterium]
MHPMRLVIDTNVLLSALLFPSGSLTWLRSAWQSGAVLPLAIHETTVELIRVLSYPKFRLTGHEREELLMDYLPWCETVTVPEPPPVPECRDPHDRPFLELALAGRADALVTGDRDILVLSSDFSVPILTPKSLKDRLMLPESTD